MHYENISYQQIDEFTIITIRCPNLSNKLSIGCMNDIMDALKRSQCDDKCDVVIITGKGEYFCGGGELGDYQQQNAQDILDFADTLVNLLRMITEYKKLVVAAVNGHVEGGGMSLLECCDLAVALHSCRFSIPEINSGLAPMISLMGIRNHFSRKQCMEMITFGKKLDSNMAQQYGIINQICETNLIDTTIDYLRQFITKNGTAFSLCKQYYNITQGLSYAQQFEIGKHYLVSMLKSF